MRQEITDAKTSLELIARSIIHLHTNFFSYDLRPTIYIISLLVNIRERNIQHKISLPAMEVKIFSFTFAIFLPKAVVTEVYSRSLFGAHTESSLFRAARILLKPELQCQRNQIFRVRVNTTQRISLGFRFYVPMRSISTSIQRRVMR